MPIYEYHCASCGADFELLIRAAEDERRTACPRCGTTKIERKLSVFAARAAAAPSRDLPRAGGCGRCGDPDGPCGLD